MAIENITGEPLEGIRNEDIYRKKPKNKTTKQKTTDNKTSEGLPEPILQDLQDYAKFAENPLLYYSKATATAEMSAPHKTEAQIKSKYDPITGIGLTGNRLQDIRSESQSEWLKLLNGITKGVITTGTTFINNMAGLPVALAQGFVNLGDEDATTTFLSGFWDNPLTKATQAVTEWRDKAIPNYYDSQGRNTWGNLIGDKFLKNMGFMLGTVASAYTGNALGVGAGALISRGGAAMAGKLASRIVGDSLKAAKASTFTRGFITSAYNSFAEAAIEASNNSKEWYDAQKYNLDTELMAGNIDENQYNERLQQLKLDKTKMGNADFLGNVALLTLSNSIQFGRAFGTGFETGQSFLRTMQENNLYKIAQGKPETVLKGLRGAVAEGLEEVNQKAISAMSGLAAEEDYLAYFKNRNDYNSQKFVNRVINNFNKGIKDTYTDPASLEEFAIGALIGFTGVPFMKRVSVTNPDGTTTMKNKFGMVGGLFDELSEYKATVAEQQPYIDEVNNHMVERQERMRNLMTHAASQKEQGAFLMDKNKFNYKNSEFKELFADVDLYSRLGILDDLKQMWSQLEVDDNTINDIIQAGTSDEGPKQKSIGTDDNGNPVDREEIKSRIENAKQNVLDTIEQYRKTRFDVMTDSRGLLSDEQLSQLTWMKMMGRNWETRLNEMLSENDNELQNTVKEAINTFIESDAVKSNKDGDRIARSLERSSKNKDLFSYIANHPGIYTKIRENIPSESVSKFDDCVKCARGIDNFNKKTAEYLHNPSLLESDMDKSLKDMRNMWYDEEIDRSFLGVELGATSKEDIFDMFSNIESNVAPQYKDEYLQRLSDRINKEDSSNIFNGLIKQSFERYKNIKKETDDFSEASAALLETGKITEKKTIDELTKLADYINKVAPREMFVNNKKLDDIVDDFIKNEDVSSQLKNRIKKAIEEIQLSKTTAESDTSSATETKETPVAAVTPKEKDTTPESEFDAGDVIPSDGTLTINQIAALRGNNLVTDLSDEGIKEIAAEKKQIADADFGSVVAEPVSKVDSAEMNPDNSGAEPIVDDENDYTKDEQANIVSNWNGYDSLGYNVNALKQRRHEIELVNKPLANRLRELGVYEYIDGGKLNDLIRKNEKNNEPTQVFYVFNNTDETFTYTDKEGKTRKQILLAVKDETGSVEIEGERYQIVGTLGGKFVDNKPNKNLLQQIKQAVAEYSSNEHTGDWFVCKNTYNYVRKIYGGRFVKMTKDQGLSETVRNLGDVLINNTPLRIAEDIDKRIGFYIIRENDNVIHNVTGLPIQAVNEMSKNLYGSIWLLTKQADGRMYPRYCSVKTASAWYNQLQKDAAGRPVNNELYNTIEGLCQIICDPQSTNKDKYIAKAKLKKYLYMGPMVENSWRNDIHIKETTITSPAFKNNVTLTGNKDTDTKALVDALFSRESQLRMQFDVKMLKDNSSDYIQFVLNNDILETDLLQVENVNASFDMFPNAFGPSAPKENKMTKQDVLNEMRRTRGEILINPENIVKAPTTFLNDKNYVKEDGKWYLNGEEVMDVESELLDFCLNIDTKEGTKDSKGTGYYKCIVGNTTYYIEKSINSGAITISEDTYNTALVNISNEESIISQMRGTLIEKIEEAPKQEEKKEIKKQEIPSVEKKNVITTDMLKKPESVKPTMPKDVEHPVSDEVQTIIKNNLGVNKPAPKLMTIAEELNKKDEFKHWDIIVRIPKDLIGSNDNYIKLRNGFLRGMAYNTILEKDFETWEKYINTRDLQALKSLVDQTIGCK